MKYFGTDGIRQKADQFTPNFLANIVNGLVDYTGSQAKVLIGGDTRESTEWILADLESALETFGIEYGNVGVLPTPAICYCFHEMGIDFAIDVTASHNPYQDNGIKIFEYRKDNTGKATSQKLSDQGCEIIEKHLASPQDYDLISPSLREDLHDEAVDLYKEHLLNYLESADFSNLHIGMDCADGATSVINKTIFEQLGAQVELIHSDASYNRSINHDCGSTHLESLIDLVKTHQLDFGIAFDGDGDRTLMVDANGNIVDGDDIIAILTNFLNLNQIAVTVMANQGLLNWAQANHIHAEITPVGDSNVAAAMRNQNIPIGGEQSGHIILPGQPTGDGMLTALMVTKIVAETGSTLSELASIITKLPQVIVNLPATPAQKTTLATSDAVKDIISHFEEKVKSVNGRLLVRPSGTENLIRITMWGDDEAKITQLADSLSHELKSTL